MSFEIVPKASNKVRGFAAGSSVEFDCKDDESARELCDALNRYVEIFTIGRRTAIWQD
jgi:hypothetical protein